MFTKSCSYMVLNFTAFSSLHPSERLLLLLYTHLLCADSLRPLTCALSPPLILIILLYKFVAIVELFVQTIFDFGALVGGSVALQLLLMVLNAEVSAAFVEVLYLCCHYLRQHCSEWEDGRENKPLPRGHNLEPG